MRERHRSEAPQARDPLGIQMTAHQLLEAPDRQPPEKEEGERRRRVGEELTGQLCSPSLFPSLLFSPFLSLSALFFLPFISFHFNSLNSALLFSFIPSYFLLSFSGLFNFLFSSLSPCSPILPCLLVPSLPFLSPYFCFCFVPFFFILPYLVFSTSSPLSCLPFSSLLIPSPLLSSFLFSSQPNISSLFFTILFCLLSPSSLLSSILHSLPVSCLLPAVHRVAVMNVSLSDMRGV